MLVLISLSGKISTFECEAKRKIGQNFRMYSIFNHKIIKENCCL